MVKLRQLAALWRTAFWSHFVTGYNIVYRFSDLPHLLKFLSHGRYWEGRQAFKNLPLM